MTDPDLVRFPDPVHYAIEAVERREAPARTRARYERRAWADLIEAVLTQPEPPPPTFLERLRATVRRAYVRPFARGRGRPDG